jgi:cysteinyl-tRNA synthetase
LSMDQTKMSKSLGNVLLVHDLIKTVPGEVIRLALLSAHYKQPLDWSGETLESARRMLDRLYGAVQGIDVPDDVRAAVDVPDALVAALQDDLNSPKALSVFFGLAKDLNKATDVATKAQLAAEMFACGELMGLLGDDPDAWFEGHVEGELTSGEIAALIEKRNAAKAAGDYAAADAVRDGLKEQGITIQDGREGTTWRHS